MYNSSKLLALFLALFMLSITSCSEYESEQDRQNLLIGKWEEIDAEIYGNIWTFNADGSFIWGTQNYPDWDEHGTWKLQDDVIVLFGDDKYYQIKKLNQTHLIVQDIEDGHSGETTTFIRVQKDNN